ncbi:MAG: cytochrome c oxidase subunit II [Planctomycetota bacterium]
MLQHGPWRRAQGVSTLLLVVMLTALTVFGVGPVRAGDDATPAAAASTTAGGGQATIEMPGTNPAFPLPEDISTYGPEVDYLFYLILWITGITFIGTEALLIYCMLRFRHREGAKSQFVHGNHTIEIIWTTVPALILFFLAVYQLGAWKEIKMEHLDPADPAEIHALHVQVLAKQFEWNFRYPGPDGKFGTDDDFYTAKLLVVPVHTRVLLEMRSGDVIHSLFAPYLRFKQDVVPGSTVHGWFECTKTTQEGQAERHNPGFNYEIACTELCGIDHGQMRAEMDVLSDADFKAWEQKQEVKYQNTEAPSVWTKRGDPGWYCDVAKGQIPLPPSDDDSGN